MRVVSPYCKQRKLGVGLETRLENCCVLLYGALMSPTHRSRMDRLGKTPPTSMPCCRRCCKTSTPVLRGGIYSACVTWYAAHVTWYAACHMVCCTCHMVCCICHMVCCTWYAANVTWFAAYVIYMLHVTWYAAHVTWFAACVTGYGSVSVKSRRDACPLPLYLYTAGTIVPMFVLWAGSARL